MMRHLYCTLSNGIKHHFEGESFIIREKYDQISVLDYYSSKWSDIGFDAALIIHLQIYEDHALLYEWKKTAY